MTLPDSWLTIFKDHNIKQDYSEMGLRLRVKTAEGTFRMQKYGQEIRLLGPSKPEDDTPLVSTITNKASGVSKDPILFINPEVKLNDKDYQTLFTSADNYFNSFSGGCSHT